MARNQLLCPTAVCLVLAAFSGCDSQSSRMLRSGQAHLDAREWELAVECFTEALRTNPASVQARLGRATALERKRDLAAAVEDYEQVLDLEPAHPIRERVVLLLLDLNETTKALDCLQGLTDKLPADKLSLLQARAELQRGDAAAAIEHLQRATATNGENADAWYFLGMAHVKSGADQQAEADFSKSIESAPQSAKAFWQRSLVRSRLGREETAEEDRKKAVELDPSHGFVDSSVGKSVLQSIQGDDESRTLSTLQEPKPH